MIGQLEPLERKILDHWLILAVNYKKFILGLSGGVDSVCLLFILIKVKKYLPNFNNIIFGAIHINHGISPNAFLWQDFCTKLCDSLDIKITSVGHKVVKGGGESLENNARQVRYKEYTNFDTEVIILAHHLNDQVETVLSQIFRGSELHNIAGMKIVNNKLGKIYFRPLITTLKSELIEYAKKNKLNYVNDESNLDNKYLRNFIRNELIPKGLAFDNNLLFKLTKFSNDIQNILEVLDELSEEDFNNTSTDLVGNKSFYIPRVMIVDKFIKLNFGRQKSAICLYLKKNSLLLPSENQIKEFLRQVVESNWDKNPSMSLKHGFKLVKIKNYIGLTRGC